MSSISWHSRVSKMAMPMNRMSGGVKELMLEEVHPLRTHFTSHFHSPNQSFFHFTSPERNTEKG